MKILLCISALLALAGGCNRHAGSSRDSQTPPTPPTFSSFDPPGATNEIQAHMMRFVEADLVQILALYQDLSGRSIIRSPAVPMNIKITFENTTAMTRAEALQALDNVLAAQNITMVYLGTRYVKVVPSAQAAQEPGPVVEIPWQELPDSSSYLTYIARLKHLAAEQAVPALQPFAKLPNSIIGVRGSDVIVLRDYSANVRRMMQVLEMTDKPGTNFWAFPGRK
jgi:type II secretory pathway component GspD/PulD (secretin)